MLFTASIRNYNTPTDFDTYRPVEQAREKYTKPTKDRKGHGHGPPNTFNLVDLNWAITKNTHHHMTQRTYKYFTDQNKPTEHNPDKSPHTKLIKIGVKVG